MVTGGRGDLSSRGGSNIKRDYLVSITIINFMVSINKRSSCCKSRKIHRLKERIEYCLRNCRKSDREV
jgi:hypothetical protein